MQTVTMSTAVEQIVAIKSPSGEQIFPRRNTGKTSNKPSVNSDFDRKAKKDKIKVSQRNRGRAVDPNKEIPIEAVSQLVPRDQVIALADPVATEKLMSGEEVSLNSTEKQQANWSAYLDRIRGVSNRAPDGAISLRKFCKVTGMSVSTIRGLSLSEMDPDKTPLLIVMKLARCGGLTEYELRQFISYSTFYIPGISTQTSVKHSTSSKSLEDIESYLSSSPLDALVKILKIVSNLIANKIGEVPMLIQDDGLLSEANSYLLDLLDEFQSSQELSDEEFNDLKRIYRISETDIESLEKDERPSIKLIGNIARLTGKTIDDLMSVVNKSFP